MVHVSPISGVKTTGSWVKYYESGTLNIQFGIKYLLGDIFFYLTINSKGVHKYQVHTSGRLEKKTINISFL